MKKSNLIKLVSILLITLMVMMFSTNVLAANNTSNGFEDLTSTITSNNTSNNTANNNTSNNTNNAKNNTNTNNASIYNNTSLPKTGIEDSIPVALLVVVFGISAIYAYRKVKEYKNI